MYALGSTKFSVGVSFVVLLLVLGTRGQTCDPMSPSCPRNAVCEEIMSGMFRCVCAPGFYDFPPNRVIERDGCLGELNVKHFNKRFEVKTSLASILDVC